MKAYAEKLEQIIAQTRGQSIVANQYFQWFGFDVMGQVAFSKDFNMLKDMQWHSGIKVLHDGIAPLGPLTPVPWFVIMGSDMAMGSADDFKNMVCLRLNSLPTCNKCETIENGFCALKALVYNRAPEMAS